MLEGKEVSSEPTMLIKEQATINQERQLFQVPVSMPSMYLSTEVWEVALEEALEAASVEESVAALEVVLEEESVEVSEAVSEEATLDPAVLTT